MTQTLPTPSGACATATPAPLAECQTDAPLIHESRRLYGDLRKLGVALTWQEFQTVRTSDWSQNLSPQALVFCLNLTGQATVQYAANVLHLGPSSAVFFLPRSGVLQATRQAGQRHRFLTLEFSARYLRRYLSACDGALHPQIDEFVGAAKTAGPGEVRRLSHEQEALARRMVQPPVFQAARDLWYHGQVLQLMAEFFFERKGEDELFCDRQKRLARERVERVSAILQRDLITPPTLEAIGREVGCSPFHLSRTFSQQMGMTIPQYLRNLRLARAAELLRGGKHNVTEAALEVGYSSLSHFSQAFCQVMGCCPALYPLKTATDR